MRRFAGECPEDERNLEFERENREKSERYIQIRLTRKFSVPFKFSRLCAPAAISSQHSKRRGAEREIGDAISKRSTRTSGILISTQAW